jgi:hypothetical protein
MLRCTCLLQLLLGASLLFWRGWKGWQLLFLQRHLKPLLLLIYNLPRLLLLLLL